MLKIFMVSFTGKGGHPVYVNEVIVALNKNCSADVKVEFLAPQDLEKKYFRNGYVVHADLPAYPVRGKKLNALWRTEQIGHFIRSYLVCFLWLRKQKDSCGVHFQDSLWLLGMFFWVFRFLKVPLFFTVHNIKPHKYSGLMPHVIEEKFYKFVWRSCEGLFVHSQGLKSEAIQFLGNGHPSIYVVPHGLFLVNSSVMTPLLIRMNKKRLLFFGAIRENKGLHLLLEAMKSLDGFELTIAGKIADHVYWRETVTPLLDSLRLQDKKVTLIDVFIPDHEVAALFDSHSAVILSYTQGFHSQSGVLHLAVVLDTPVVATSVGGIGDLIEKYKVGTLARSCDAAQVKDAILSLFKEEAGQLQANFNLAKEDLSWVKLAAGTCHAYKFSQSLKKKNCALADGCVS